MPQRPRTLDTRPRAVSPEAARPSAARRGYGRRWRRTRASQLAQHPECHDCRDRGLTVAASEVDHIDGRGPNGPRGHDPDNLRSLCKACHSRKTVRQDGGLGHHLRV